MVYIFWHTGRKYLRINFLANQISVGCWVDCNKQTFFFVTESFMARCHYTMGSHTPSKNFPPYFERVSYRVSILAGDDPAIDKTNFTQRQWRRCSAFRINMRPHSRGAAEKTLDSEHHLKSCLRMHFVRHYVPSIFFSNVWNPICSMERNENEITVCITTYNLSSCYAPCHQRKRKSWSKKEQRLKCLCARCTHLPLLACGNTSQSSSPGLSILVRSLYLYLRCIKCHSCMNADMLTAHMCVELLEITFLYVVRVSVYDFLHNTSM